MQDVVEPLCGHGQGCLGSLVPWARGPVAQQECVGRQSGVLAHTSPAEGALRLEWNPHPPYSSWQHPPNPRCPKKGAVGEAEAQP